MDEHVLKKTRSLSRVVLCSPLSGKRRLRKVKKVTVKKPKLHRRQCLLTEYKVSAFPKVWTEFRIHNLFCDGTIRSRDNKEYSINRAILAAVSPYFKIVFTSRWKRTGHNDKIFTVDLPAEILDLMVNFAYTGLCNITYDNVSTLLPAADQYEFQDIVKACCNFLVQQLTTDNCIGILQFGKAYFLNELEQSCMKFIREQFIEVVKCAQFVMLTAEELRSILIHDELNSRYEEIVFEAIMKWINHKSDDREKHFVDLAPCVRFGLLDPEFLTETVLLHPYVQRCSPLHSVIVPVVIMLTKKHGDDVDLSLTISRPRIPHEVVFTIGGWRDGAATSVVETYDTRADRWFFSSVEVPVERAYHGLCTVGNVIYMVGGMDGQDFYNTVRSYDPVSRKWTPRSCMHQARSYVSVVSLNGMVYAMGGYNGRQRLDSAERYSPTQNQWYLIASMSFRRSDASATTLNGKIYVVGGFTGDHVLQTAEVYDPQHDQWSHVPSMLNARSGVGLVAYHDAIYAIGGFDGMTRLQSAECFDPENSTKWKQVTDMFSPRSNFAAVVLDDMIFVIGGFDGSTTTTYVECYDELTKEWYGAANLTLNRSALGACVVRGLPNVREYSFTSYFPDQKHGLPVATVES